MTGGGSRLTRPRPGDWLKTGGHRYRLTAVEDGMAWFGPPLKRQWVPEHSLRHDFDSGGWVSEATPDPVVPGQVALPLEGINE